jgi:Asp-tRNA(Asn)/Glu-tRNA(Gln) amidotransferase A subunit family amidase
LISEFDHLDATAIAEGVRLGKWIALDVAEYFLSRIQRGEPGLQTLASFEPDLVRTRAMQMATTGRTGPLAGVPIGIKDIFDTVDYPTEFFSPLYVGNRPSRDAYAVSRMRQTGGIVVGKTHTTEFAFMHTGPTRNPHDRHRTPGSSSAGSAAGVAAGFFPLALGTQTAGSLIKPASYCGVYGYKPSFGLVSLEGVKPLAPSFDTVGWYGRSARDLDLVARQLIPNLPSSTIDARRARIAFCRTMHWKVAEEAVAFAIERAVDCIDAAGHAVQEIQLPSGFDSVSADHQLINDAEGARSLRVEAEAAGGNISSAVVAMINRAESTTWEQELAARRRVASLAPALGAIFESFDVIVGASCGIVAPIGLGSTGPSDFIKLWTTFGLPQANIPLPREAGALPVGLQVIGAFRNDAVVLRLAEQIAQVLQPPLYGSISSIAG